MLNTSLPWEKGERPGDTGGPSQCKQYVNGSQSAVVDCEAGWDYNVTEGLRNNIVTEVKTLRRIAIMESLFLCCGFLWEAYLFCLHPD